jgi:hypothetical protein
MRYQAPASPDVIAALELALALKRMQVSLYSQATGAAGFVNAEDAAAIDAIRAHEVEHEAALSAALSARGGTPAAAATYDFTAGGAIPGFGFTAGNYPTFVGIAQGIEDLSTRALKGQLERLMSDKAALSLVLAMHAVEAEHSARVRRLRGEKSWITQGSRGTMPAFFDPVYAGDELATQGAVNVSTLPLTALNGGADAATQAFDEPLAAAQVTAVMDAFVV